MKTIYLLQKNRKYGNAAIMLRAYESKADAEDIIAMMKKADVEDLEVVELELQPDKDRFATVGGLLAMMAMPRGPRDDDEEEEEDEPQGEPADAPEPKQPEAAGT